MISWAEAYRRSVAESGDFRLLFGRSYPIDEFRYYAYPLKFESLNPALLSAAAATPNTGSLSATDTFIGGPTVQNIVPGAAQESLILFPAGAIILGITSAAIVPQRIVNRESGDITFTYGPTRHPGKRDTFLLDLEFADTADIVGQNPIPEVSINANSPTNTAPPILADALMGGGAKDVMPTRELIITPGLGILARVRSMVLLNDTATNQNNVPNMSVHLCFHCMIPGVVRRSQAA